MIRYLLAALLFVVSLSAQSPYTYKKTIEEWTETTQQWVRGFGQPGGGADSTVTVEIHQPADSSGNIIKTDTAHPNGFPVLVFMHGFGVLGSSYKDLAEWFAENGYILITVDHQPYGLVQMHHEAALLHPQLGASPLYVASGALSNLDGCIDFTKTAIGGHSDGGGRAFVVSSDALGKYSMAHYDAIVTWAAYEGIGGAWMTATSHRGIEATLPALLIVGKGDYSSNHSFVTATREWFDETTLFTKNKVRVVLKWATQPPGTTTEVGHNDPIYDGGIAEKSALFIKSMETAKRWLDYTLSDDLDALSDVVGPNSLPGTGPDFYDEVNASFRVPLTQVMGTYPNAKLLTYCNSFTPTATVPGYVLAYWGPLLGTPVAWDGIVGTTPLGVDPAANILASPYTTSFWATWGSAPVGDLRPYVLTPTLVGIDPAVLGGYLQTIAMCSANIADTTEPTISPVWSNTVLNK